MGLIKTGMTLGAGYYMVKHATSAIEKHDQAKMQYNPQNQQFQGQQPQQQLSSSRDVDGRQTYGKYIAPDGTEHILYEPMQGQYQPAQPQLQNQRSRSMENQTREPQFESTRSIEGSRSPKQFQGGYFPQGSSTPPPYLLADLKN